MKKMSFYMAKEEFQNSTFDVTRRLAWSTLKVGDRVMAATSAVALPPGRRGDLGVIEIVSITREPLSKMEDDPVYGAEECRRTGYEFSPREYVDFFCAITGCLPGHEVNRIQFRRVEA